MHNRSFAPATYEQIFSIKMRIFSDEFEYFRKRTTQTITWQSSNVIPRGLGSNGILKCVRKLRNNGGQLVNGLDESYTVT